MDVHEVLFSIITSKIIVMSLGLIYEAICHLFTLSRLVFIVYALCSWTQLFHNSSFLTNTSNHSKIGFSWVVQAQARSEPSL